MDTEALKIILDLKEENIKLRQAIAIATVMAASRKSHFILYEQDNIAKSLKNEVSALYSQIRELISDIEKSKQPTDNSKNPGNN
jgi:Holliday junction resolvasome RuvABC endonuclease subunit